MAGSFKPYRRTALAASAVGISIIATALTGPGVGVASAGEPATLATAGTSNATAQSYRVNPTTAALSLGISFGVSLTGYTNNVAQAEARGIDLGIIGSTLSAAGCDGGDPTLPADQQPQPLHADSRDKDAGQVKTANEKYVGGVITKTVRADATPSADASTGTADASGAVVSLSGARSTATSHLAGGVRESIATADVGKFGIKGILELSGMHWNAASRSGKVDENSGGFTIGSLKVLGQSIPVQDASKAFDAANTLLAAVGLQLVFPTSHVSAGIQFVEPLKISVVPSKTRDSVLSTVLGLIQPVRQNLYDALLKEDCSNATYILVSDIAIGSVTGAGSLSLELGGVSTKSEALKTSSFLGIDPTGSLGGNDSFSGAIGGLVDTPVLSDLSPIAPTTGKTTPQVSQRPRHGALAVAEKGSRGGRLALIGLIGLLVLLVVADRDRRLMRRAQRNIPTEA
ncbi:MAG: hypothetical protein QOJ00_1194 [Actinomycetota bacterium]|jgi:hypothetical protein